MIRYRPFKCLFFVFTLFASQHAAAEPIEYQCNVLEYCPRAGKCVEAPVKNQFSVEGQIDLKTRMVDRMVLNAQEFTVPLENVEKGEAYFEIYSAMTPYSSAILFSISSEGFFVTEHGLVGDEPFGVSPDSLKLGMEYSANFRTFTGYCIFPEMEFEGED